MPDLLPMTDTDALRAFPIRLRYRIRIGERKGRREEGRERERFEVFLGLGVGTRDRTRGQSHGLGAINMSGKPMGALDAFWRRRWRGWDEASLLLASGLLNARLGFLQVILNSESLIWKIEEYIYVCVCVIYSKRNSLILRNV